MVGAAPGAPADIFAAERCEVLLQELHHMRLQTRAECLAHLGRHFRVVLDQPASASDVAVGEELLRQYLFIHLKTNTEKVALMVLMLQKLYQLARTQRITQPPTQHTVSASGTQHPAPSHPPSQPHLSPPAPRLGRCSSPRRSD